MQQKFSKKKLFSLAALSTAVTATLVGCYAPEVPLEPAINANDPACAEVIIRLPDMVGDQEQRRTNAQSTGAWGNPSTVELFCGIEPSGPTTERCVNVNDIDWIIDPSNDPIYRFEAYGRSPGLEVLIDSTAVSGTDVISSLSTAVSQLPQTRHCTDLSDVIN